MGGVGVGVGGVEGVGLDVGLGVVEETDTRGEILPWERGVPPEQRPDFRGRDALWSGTACLLALPETAVWGPPAPWLNPSVFLFMPSITLLSLWSHGLSCGHNIKGGTSACKGGGFKNTVTFWGFYNMLKNTLLMVRMPLTGEFILSFEFQHPSVLWCCNLLWRKLCNVIILFLFQNGIHIKIHQLYRITLYPNHTQFTLTTIIHFI